MRRGCRRRLFLGPEGPHLSCPFTSRMSWVMEIHIQHMKHGKYGKHQQEHLGLQWWSFLWHIHFTEDKVNANYCQDNYFQWSLSFMTKSISYKWSTVTCEEAAPYDMFKKPLSGVMSSNTEEKCIMGRWWSLRIVMLLLAMRGCLAQDWFNAMKFPLQHGLILTF